MLRQLSLNLKVQNFGYKYKLCHRQQPLQKLQQQLKLCLLGKLLKILKINYLFQRFRLKRSCQLSVVRADSIDKFSL